MNYKLLNLKEKSKESLKLIFYKRDLYIQDLNSNYIQLNNFDMFIAFLNKGCNIYWGYEEEIEFGYLDSNE